MIESIYSREAMSLYMLCLLFFVTPGACQVPEAQRLDAVSNSTIDQSSTTSMSVSYTTVTIECPATVTITLPAISQAATYTVSTTMSACTGTSAACPCAQDYTCMAVGVCTWECLKTTGMTSFVTSTAPQTAATIQPTTTALTTLSSTLATTTAVMTASSSELASATSATTTAAATSYIGSSTSGAQLAAVSSIPYADATDLEAYLPCVPGTFICTDASTWYTCDEEASGSYDYQYPRTVAAGMQCLPDLSTASSIGWDTQQGSVPDGYYRNDLYARATPNGTCTVDGSLQCTDSGQGFEVCDQGAWIDMGSVAAGTVCQNGEIVDA